MRMMRVVGVLACVAFPAAMRAQAATAPSPEPPPVQVANGTFFALSVAEMQPSVRWYSEKLGLKVTMEMPKREKAAVVVLEGGGLTVELVQHDDAVPFSQAAPAAGTRQFLVHGLFKVGAVVENYERTVATLRARGVEVVAGPFPAREGQRANVLFRDNTGNLIQLFGK